MPELQRLHPDHVESVRSFELANRAWFAASISDRGDDYFAQFDEQFDELLVDQEAGLGAFRVLVDQEGSVLGRLNLEFLGEAGTAGTVPGHSPVVPSSCSRRMSRWPACRAVSSIMCNKIHRRFIGPSWATSSRSASAMAARLCTHAAP